MFFSTGFIDRGYSLLLFLVSLFMHSSKSGFGGCLIFFSAVMVNNSPPQFFFN